MIERRGCNLNLSFGAFHKNELVGFTLNGIGNWNDKLTAYDTGTGVIKEFRKKGIATRMFNESLPILKEHNIAQYLLEVICSNTSAFELYKKAGFKVVREFDYYISSKKDLNLRSPKEGNKYRIEEIKTPNWDLLKSFWDFEPSWQNSIDSINRKISSFKISGIYKSDTLLGYGIIEKHTGDIPQLAISKGNRRIGLGTRIFNNLVSFSDGENIKIINTDSKHSPFKNFAKSIKLKSRIGQYEMLMQL